MVFRKDNKVDAFQRQISALRQQLGSEEDAADAETPAEYQGSDAEEGIATSPARRDRFDARETPEYPFGGSEFGEAAPRSFAPEAEAPPPPALPQLRGDGDASVIAHDAVWRGDFQTEGTVHVHGRFEGSIVAKRDVFVAEEADVDATVSAENVVVAGLVKGTVRCDTRFEVLPQGRIFGDIHSPTLVIHEGARVNGRFRMGVPEAASSEQPPPAVVQRRAARGG